jgi:hypothetical protein
MAQLLVTRTEIENRLNRGLVGKTVCYTTVRNTKLIGMIQRIAVNDVDAELMITLIIKLPNKLDRQECDIVYFIENTEILYGNTYTGERRDIRRILKGD